MHDFKIPSVIMLKVTDHIHDQHQCKRIQGWLRSLHVENYLIWEKFN